MDLQTFSERAALLGRTLSAIGQAIILFLFFSAVAGCSALVLWSTWTSP